VWYDENRYFRKFLRAAKHAIPEVFRLAAA
jgi:hypothetical protein